MKILTSTQFKELDKYTIEHEPVSSTDLMERAAKAITRELARRWDTSTRFFIFAGPGNNGGDALAVARMLHAAGYTVQPYLFNITGRLSNDCLANKSAWRTCREWPSPKFHPNSHSPNSGMEISSWTDFLAQD